MKMINNVNHVNDAEYNYVWYNTYLFLITCYRCC